MAQRKVEHCTVCEKHKPLRFVAISQAQYESGGGQGRNITYGLTADGRVYSYHPAKCGWVALSMCEVG